VVGATVLERRRLAASTPLLQRLTEALAASVAAAAAAAAELSL